MKILRYSILLLTILAFFSRPCPGEFYSTIYGKVIDEETGVGIKGVDVFKIGVNLGITGSRPTVTDSDGLYRLGRLPAGRIEIELSKEGLWWRHITGIEINYNQIKTNLQMSILSWIVICIMTREEIENADSCV